MITSVDYLLFWGVSSLGYGMMMHAFSSNVVWIAMIGDIMYADFLQRCGYLTTQYKLSRILVMFAIGMHSPHGVEITESIFCIIYIGLILLRDYMHNNNLINDSTEFWFTVLIIVLYMIEAFDMLNHHGPIISALYTEHDYT